MKRFIVAALLLLAACRSLDEAKAEAEMSMAEPVVCTKIDSWYFCTGQLSGRVMRCTDTEAPCSYIILPPSCPLAESQ